jgi:hypothetical protein
MWLRSARNNEEKTIMKLILSALLALSVLAGIAGSASAGIPECDGYLRPGLDCWHEAP